MSVYISLDLCVSLPVSVYVSTCVCVRVFLCLCVCVYLYVYVSVCVCVSLYSWGNIQRRLSASCFAAPPLDKKPSKLLPALFLRVFAAALL